MDTPVVVAEQLDLPSYCSEAAEEDLGKGRCEKEPKSGGTVAGQQPKAVYSLLAVRKHSGRSLMAGHYTAQCRSALANKWFDCNDAEVTEYVAVGGPSPEAYVMFYKRQD